MPIIGNFPVERDWGTIIDSLKVAIMSGEIMADILTNQGDFICTDSNVNIVAVKKL